MIWRVYPRPADKIPVYKISNHSKLIFFKVGSSKVKAKISDKIKTTKY